MTRQSKYPEKFRLEATKLVVEEGYTLKQAAKQLGVTDWSIRLWIKKFRESGQLASKDTPQPKADDYRALYSPRLVDRASRGRGICVSSNEMYPRNFYHFTVQHLSGLYAALDKMGQGNERSVPIFYGGPYHRLVSSFSKLPIRSVEETPSDSLVSTPATSNDYLMQVSRVLNGSVLSRPKQRHILIIQRRKNRVIQNIRLLVNALVPLAPVKVHVFDKMSFDQQVFCVRSAKAVVCAHGAALTHMMFANQCTPFVEVRPFGFQWGGFGRLADLFGHPLLSIECGALGHEHTMLGKDWACGNVEAYESVRDLVWKDKHVRRIVRDVPWQNDDIESIAQWL